MSPRKAAYQPPDHTSMNIPQNKIEVAPTEKARPTYQPPDHTSMNIPQVKTEVRPGEKAKPAYQPPDHTSMIPQNKIEVTATEKPKGLPKYVPPNHASVVCGVNFFFHSLVISLSSIFIFSLEVTSFFVSMPLLYVESRSISNFHFSPFRCQLVTSCYKKNLVGIWFNNYRFISVWSYLVRRVWENRPILEESVEWLFEAY